MPATITVSSVFPAPAERIWGLLGRVETLRTIARPYAFFTPLDDISAWSQGGTYRMTFRVFGLIPTGIALVLMLIRTAQEDKTLENELEGYKEYKAKVKYRLIPLIW